MLDNGLELENISLGMKCIEKGMEMIITASPWHGERLIVTWWLRQLFE